VPFDIGVPIAGDVTIGLWFGAYNLGQRLHSRPAAAYAFHTAFFEEKKVERITVHQLDVADPALFPPDAQRQFFMDIQLAPYTAETAPPIEFEGDGEALAGCVMWMRDKWRELMGKMYGTDDRRGASPDRRMDAVVSEVKDFIKDRAQLRKSKKSLVPPLKPPQDGAAGEVRARESEQGTPRVDTNISGREKEADGQAAAGTPGSLRTAPSGEGLGGASLSPSPRDGCGRLQRRPSSGGGRSPRLHIGRKRSRGDEILALQDELVATPARAGTDPDAASGAEEEGLSGRGFPVQRSLEPELLHAARASTAELNAADLAAVTDLAADIDRMGAPGGRQAKPREESRLGREAPAGSAAETGDDEEALLLRSAPVTPQPQREPSQHYSLEQEGRSAGKGKRGAALFGPDDDLDTDLGPPGAGTDGALLLTARQKALRGEEGLDRQGRPETAARDGVVSDGVADGLQQRRESHLHASVSLPAGADKKLAGQQGRKAAVPRTIDVHASAEDQAAVKDSTAAAAAPSEGVVP
jgi:hypothetical protein